MSKTTKWTVLAGGSAIMAAIFLLIFKTSVVLAQPSKTTDNKTSKLDGNITTTPMTDFTLIQGDAKTELRVKSSYIDWGTAKETQQDTNLNLKMLWPSLESTAIHYYGLFNQEEYDKTEQMLQSGEYLGITLSQGRWDHMAENIHKYIQNDWAPYTEGADIPGFTRYVYKDTEKFVVGKHWAGNQILVPTDKNYADRVYIECPINNNLPTKRLYCMAHNNLDHYVYSVYTFSYANIQDWKQIDTAVRQFFDGILVTAP